MQGTCRSGARFCHASTRALGDNFRLRWRAADGMSKPIVERYEQILDQDPASTVFVELAKALIEKGDHSRAIDVCRGGLSHHKDSVVARVLWGKALINLGKPAEAMEQFDQAIAIDRQNQIRNESGPSTGFAAGQRGICRGAAAAD